MPPRSPAPHQGSRSVTAAAGAEGLDEGLGDSGAPRLGEGVRDAVGELDSDSAERVAEDDAVAEAVVDAVAVLVAHARADVLEEPLVVALPVLVPDADGERERAPERDGEAVAEGERDGRGDPEPALEADPDAVLVGVGDGDARAAGDAEDATPCVGVDRGDVPTVDVAVAVAVTVRVEVADGEPLALDPALAVPPLGVLPAEVLAAADGEAVAPPEGDNGEVGDAEALEDADGEPLPRDVSDGEAVTEGEPLLPAERERMSDIEAVAVAARVPVPLTVPEGTPLVEAEGQPDGDSRSEPVAPRPARDPVAQGVGEPVARCEGIAGGETRTLVDTVRVGEWERAAEAEASDALGTEVLLSVAEVVAERVAALLSVPTDAEGVAD